MTLPPFCAVGRLIGFLERAVRQASGGAIQTAIKHTIKTDPLKFSGPVVSFYGQGILSLRSRLSLTYSLKNIEC